MDWGAAAGMVSAVGGLFGKKATEMSPARKMRETARGARIAAEEYGFNPLTLLGNLGPSVAGGSYMSGGGPPLASLSLLADSIGAMQREFDGTNSNQREEQELRNDLLRLDVEKKKAEAAASSSLLTLPSGGRGLGAAPTQTGNFTRYERGPDGLDYKVKSDPNRGAAMIGGQRIRPAIGWDDAEVIENIYGDAASWMYGIGKLGADLANTYVPPDFGDSNTLTDWAQKAKDLNKPSGNSEKSYKVPPSGFNDAGKPYWLTPNGFSNKEPKG